jgi:pyruvate ferredoxin oxidoreductase delta subunit
MKRPKVQHYKKPAHIKDLHLGATFKSGFLVERNAGWRTFRPVVDQEKCNGCLRCYIVCPDGVIYRENEEMRVDYDFCKGCGVCAYECKVDAIEMVKEEL